MDETLLLTKYFAAWAWHLTAMMFLVAMSIILVLGNYPLAIGFGILMAFCEYKAIRRKNELDHD